MKTFVWFYAILWAVVGASCAVGNPPSPSPSGPVVYPPLGGTNWTNIANGPFRPRFFHQVLSYNNRIWILGGYVQSSPSLTNDVWSSLDGITWTNVKAQANFSGRNRFGAVVFNNRMWVVGGQTGYSNGFDTGTNDVWYSTDGASWTCANASAPFSRRFLFGLVSYNGYLWVIGGSDDRNTNKNDVWYSADGVNWQQATASADFQPRNGFGCVVFNNAMWVIGGYTNTNRASSGLYLTNDVWYSTNGTNWIRATDNAGFTARADMYCIPADGRIWFYGGRYLNAGSMLDFTNDFWMSTNGTNWQLVKTNIGTAASTGVSGAYHNGLLYLIGGYEVISYYDSVWRTD